MLLPFVIRWQLVLLVVISLVGLSSAQAMPPIHPERMNGGGICINDDREARDVYENDCHASLSEIRDWLTAPDALIVDTRSAKEFDSFRAPGTMNLSASMLQTKHHWRSRPVLLVDAGYRRQFLLQKCDALRSAGFERVRVLNGGLRYWQDKIGPLEGDPAAAKALRFMPPGVFMSDRRHGDYLLVDVAEASHSSAGLSSGQRLVSNRKMANPMIASKDLFPEAISLPFPAGDESEERWSEYQRRLTTIVMERVRQYPATRVVFVDFDGSLYSRLRRFVEPLGLPEVFYLEGGAAGYQDFLARHELILAQAQAGGRPTAGGSCGRP